MMAALDAIRSRAADFGQLEVVDEAGAAARDQALGVAGQVAASVRAGVEKVLLLAGGTGDAFLLHAGIASIETNLQTGAIALAIRPWSAADEFATLWGPWEPALGLLASERAVR
jgi:hypothetical protein